MRRILAILLLVLMPLQAGWAAASAYCQHETGAAAAHFGHHEHQHHSGDGGREPAKSAGADPDCGACHASASFTLPHLAGVSALPLPMAPPPSFILPALPEHASAPERPNWLAPA